MNLNKEEEGEIIVEPDEELYDEDTTVSLTAEPEEDWDFAYWEGLKNTKAETKVVMDSDKTINGIFGEIL
ncbi:MAG: InlB B-repeat-containing protein, partial [Bacillota bacterium]